MYMVMTVDGVGTSYDHLSVTGPKDAGQPGLCRSATVLLDDRGAKVAR